METNGLRAEAEDVLRALAGPDAALREDQWQAIEALTVGRRRVLVVQRTGWGKSAVYFVATALLRARGAGATVIVSPLLALMRNQVAAAERAGITARTINSANMHQWDEVRAEVEAGTVDVLLVSPERLNNPDFRDTVLPRLAAATGLLVVDEAHCISDWGHDFRPDYRRIRTLLGELPAGVPVLATTATANARVVADVADQLAEDAVGSETVVFRGSLDRTSLRLGVLRLPTDTHRLAWLAEHLGELPGSGIIYTLTVAQADDVAAHLMAAGHLVAAYSGRTETADRQAAEDDLLANRVKALVATSALGMGFDKPDLGFVIHLGAPQSPIAYYQQVGRAGRAVTSASVLLLPGEQDEAIWRYYASVGFPAEVHVRETLDVLAAADRPLSTPALEAQVELSRSRLDTMLKVLDVDGAVRRVRGGWVTTGQGWSYDAERYARVAAARSLEQQAMRDYLATPGCRMDFLRRQLDDPQVGEPCGRCDRCAGPFWSEQVSEAALKASSDDLDQVGVPVAPRLMWPTGLGVAGVDLSGRISAEEQCASGRVVARLSDVGWGPRLRPLVDESAPDGPVPDDIFAAVVDVLHGWGWERRPAAVVAVASGRRPLLVASLAERIAATGRMAHLGTIGRPDQPAHARTNSAQRVRWLHDAFPVDAALRDAINAVGGEPVLLVDDLIDSGWTTALAGRELRRAGATEVLPFALGQTG
jgi:ATP-dependent DNA helicase RecQ